METVSVELRCIFTVFNHVCGDSGRVDDGGRYRAATSGIDSTLWHAATIVKKESNMPLAVVQMVMSVLCALTLFGFSICPRCLWNRHQSCVLAWVYVTSFAMGIMFLRDCRKLNYTVVPVLVWALGTYLCNLFYYESSLR